MALMYASVCLYIHQDFKKSLKASSLLHTVHFIEKFTFRDHSTTTITSYYEKYYGVIAITSYYKTYYGVITIRCVLSLLYQEMLGLS